VKRLSIISAFAIAVIAVSGAALRYEVRARAEALPELLELAPVDSTFIAYADVAALRESPLVQKATALAQPPATDRDYQEFVRETGFDYERDLDQMLVAGVANATPGSIIAVADGRFDQKKIVEYALRTAKTESENGRTVYVMPSVAPGKTVAFSFLSANRIAVSDGDDVFAKPGAFSNAHLDDAMRERLSRVAGAPLFLAAKTPAQKTSSPDGGPAAFVSSLFQSVTWVDLAARPDGENVILSAEAECGTPEDAQKVATALELMRTMVQGAIAGNKGNGQVSAENVASAERLLKAASITAAADRARLLITMTPDMIKLPAASPQAKPSAH
jgi:hypothetical protein